MTDATTEMLYPTPEMTVIGIILHFQGGLVKLQRFIQPYYFEDHNLGMIYECALRGNLEREPLLLREAAIDRGVDAKKISPILSECSQVAPPSDIHLAGYCEGIRRKYRQRCAIQILAQAGDDRNDPIEILKKIQKDAETWEKEQGSTTVRPVRMSSLLGAALKEIEEGPQGIPLPWWPRLDEALGGLQEQLYVLGGAPASGKTTFVRQLADEVVRSNENAACLYVSYEVGETEMAKKDLARVANVPMGLFREKPENQSAWMWDRLSGAAAKLHDPYQRFYLIYASTMTVRQIEIAAQLLREDCPEVTRLLIVVDALQNVVPTQKYRSRREDVDGIIRELQGLKSRAKCSLWVVSHHSRLPGKESYPANRGMGANKESGGIEYSADVGINLDLPASGEEGAGGEVQLRTLHICKNRYGPPGKIEYLFNLQTAHFQEA